MPFRKNPEREELLIDYYIVGNTIKNTSKFTGIPEGSISYYFRKFKKNPEHLMLRRRSQTNVPKKKASEDVINNIISSDNLLRFLYQTVGSMWSNGKIAEARDFLESVKILAEFQKEANQVKKSATPEEREKAQKKQIGYLVDLVTVIGQMYNANSTPHIDTENAANTPEVKPLTSKDEYFEYDHQKVFQEITEDTKRKMEALKAWLGDSAL